MLPELVPISLQFAFGDRMLARLVGDFSDEDWRVRDPMGHDARWIAGHLALMRRRLVGMVGLAPLITDWETAFQRGSTPAGVPDSMTPAHLLTAFHEAHAQLSAHWDAVTLEQLAKPLGRTVPDGSDTVGGAVRFLAWHEAYHLGQLGLLRRLTGKPGVA